MHDRGSCSIIINHGLYGLHGKVFSHKEQENVEKMI